MKNITYVDDKEIKIQLQDNVNEIDISCKK